MGEAFICRRGGSNGPGTVSGYGIIAVKYPQGSTCTCSLGETVFTSGDTSRTAAAFAVPGPGNWNVAITDGSRTADVNLDVSAAGTVRTAELSYSSGDPTPVTPTPGTGSVTLLSAQSGLKSGYSVGGNAAMSGNAILESDTGGFWLSPAVDLTNYSTLTVRGIQRAAGYGAGRIRVGRSTGKVFNVTETPEAEAVWSVTLNTPDTVTLNIGGLSGAYYIGSASVNGNLEITEIILS